MICHLAAIDGTVILVPFHSCQVSASIFHLNIGAPEYGICGYPIPNKFHCLDKMIGYQFISPCNIIQGDIPQRTHDAILTSFLRQNDVATSFWLYNDVVIALHVRWDPITWQMFYSAPTQGTHDAIITSFLRQNDVIMTLVLRRVSPWKLFLQTHL